MEKEITERRKHRRFNIEVGSLDVLDPHSNEKLGDVLNISRGGLAYRYVPDAEQPFDLFKIDIFRVVDHILFLSNITCKTISDFDAAKRFPIKFNKYRLSGVHFGELTESQISQLEYCIQKYTLEEQ
jgi:hypothetical protein